MLKFCCGTLFALGLARANKSYLVALNLTVGARAAKEKNIKRKEVKRMVAAIACLSLTTILLMLMANKLSNRVSALEKYTGIEVESNERNKKK